MSDTTRARWLYALPFLCVVAIAFLVHHTGRMPFHTWFIVSADHQKYMAMAAHPFGEEKWVHVAPFCWRVLTPWLVYALPFSRTTGFWVVTVGGHLLTIGALLWFLRGVGSTRRTAAAGATAFALLGSSSGDYWDYMTVDALTIALQTLMMACAVRRHGLALLPLALLAAAQKENSVLGLVFAVGWSLERRDRRTAALAGCALLLFIGATIVIRRSIPMMEAHFNAKTYTLWGLIVSSPWNQSTTMVLKRFLAAVVGTWNVLFPIAMLQLFHPPRFLRSWTVWIVLAIATSIFVIAGDVQRNVACGAFPIAIAACAFEVDELSRRLRVSWGLLWALVFVAQLAYLFPMLCQFGVPFEDWAFDPVAPLVILGATVLCLAIVGRRETYAPRDLT